MTDNLPAVGFSFADMERLAQSIAKSGMFGIKTPEQALVLMAVSQAEGRHPALAARDYEIIQGRPAKKAEAMQRDFLAAGGKIQWHALSDTEADATFSHPTGGTVRISWDMERAQKAGINNPMYKKYPRAMLRSRVVSEGARTVFPAATSGMYVPEEVADFKPDPAGKIIDHDQGTGQVFEAENLLDMLKQQGEARAALGQDELREWFIGLDRAEKKLIKPYVDEVLKQKAIIADNMALDKTPHDWVPPDHEQTLATPPPEPPAVEEALGAMPSPQAVPSQDAFDLPPRSDAEAFCNEMLNVARSFTIPAAFDNLKKELGDGRTTRGRTAGKLPQDTYWSLISQIDEIEAKLSEAAA